MLATAVTAKFSVAYLFPANSAAAHASSHGGSFFDWTTLSMTTLIGHGCRTSASSAGHRHERQRQRFQRAEERGDPHHGLTRRAGKPAPTRLSPSPAATVWSTYAGAPALMCISSSFG